MLSNRLEEIINQICESSCLCDVGTDHGYVPVEAVRRGLCERAIAADVNQGPVDKARLNIQLEGLSDRIEAVKSDGLLSVKEGSFDQVVIAGMGGELIVKILEEGKHKLKGVRQLILQPMTQLEILRSYLISNAFVFKNEALVKDDTGKIYVVIVVELGEKPSEAKMEDIIIGPVLKDVKTELSCEYVSKILQKKKRRYEGLLKGKIKDEAELEKLRQEIDLCNEFLN